MPDYRNGKKWILLLFWNRDNAIRKGETKHQNSSFHAASSLSYPPLRFNSTINSKPYVWRAYWVLNIRFIHLETKNLTVPPKQTATSHRLLYKLIPANFSLSQPQHLGGSWCHHAVSVFDARAQADLGLRIPLPQLGTAKHRFKTTKSRGHKNYHFWSRHRCHWTLQTAWNRLRARCAGRLRLLKRDTRHFRQRTHRAFHESV